MMVAARPPTKVEPLVGPPNLKARKEQHVIQEGRTQRRDMYVEKWYVI